MIIDYPDQLFILDYSVVDLIIQIQNVGFNREFVDGFLYYSFWSRLSISNTPEWYAYCKEML
jgi:hypothetical protein